MLEKRAEVVLGNCACKEGELEASHCGSRIQSVLLIPKEETVLAHITPPEPAIHLYNDGFDPEIDLLDRAATGKSLSDLVMRIDDPLVIALDGGWGSGKSFFLKCWVGAHLKDHGNTSQTVYFDAFEHDFIDGPLASLMGVLAERLEHLGAGKGKTGKTVARETLSAFRQAALPLTRLGLAVATYGATEAAGALADSLINQTSKELEKAAEDFWARESGQRAAMAEFKTALKSVTESDDGPQKLIIVIDELDRCRPDYALSLLEIIKHFFAVPNVHFVLGVNMMQLENSVHARYGAGVDAALYLQKFVGLTMRLPSNRGEDGTSETISTYLDKAGAAMGLAPELLEPFEQVLRCTRFADEISLRSVERVLTLVALLPNTPTPLPKQYVCYQLVTATLIVTKVHRPVLYAAIQLGDVSMDKIRTEFQLKSSAPEQGSRLPYILHQAWAAFIAPNNFGSKDGWRGFIPPFGITNGTGQIEKIIRDDLETFTVPEADA